MQNLYDSIFYYLNPSFEEEDEGIYSTDIQIEISLDDYILADYSYFSYDDERQENYDNLYDFISLRSSINSQINEISANLSISKDLSYLFLKNFNWSETKTISQWNNKDLILSLLNELHVSELDIKNDLTMKIVDQKACPLCKRTGILLYKMYCGHCLCKECWTNKIKFQISLFEFPIHCKCNAEIMISDILSFCGEEMAKKCEKKIVQECDSFKKKINKMPIIFLFKNCFN